MRAWNPEYCIREPDHIRPELVNDIRSYLIEGIESTRRKSILERIKSLWH